MIPAVLRLSRPQDAARGAGAARRSSARRPRCSPEDRACCRCSSCASPSRLTWWTSAASPASTTSRRRAASCASAPWCVRRPSRPRRSSASKYPILVDTAAVIADPIVRNLATVGGNLAHGDPANDHPATMLALGAEVVATGPKGARTIPVAQFFTGLFTTALEPTEVLTEIRIPMPPAGQRGRLRQARAQGRRLRHRGRGGVPRARRAATIERAGIGLTNAGPDADQGHRGREATWPARRPTRPRSPKPARLAAAATSPSADRRGAVDYKKDMARVLTVRALAQGRRARGREVAMAKHDDPASP